MNGDVPVGNRNLHDKGSLGDFVITMYENNTDLFIYIVINSKFKPVACSFESIATYRGFKIKNGKGRGINLIFNHSWAPIDQSGCS